MKNILQKRKSIFSSFILYIKHKLGWLGSPKIQPFIGYGNRNFTYISGMVVEDNGLSKPKEGQGKWKNITSMLKRYLSNELEEIKVEVAYLGESQIATTDKFGIYRCKFQHNGKLPVSGIWQKASIRIFDRDQDTGSEDVTADVLHIAHLPQYIVISDIDDTILVSYATQKLMKLRLMLLNNAHTRMPFEGVSAFYQALQIGTVESGFNPIFYLSNSEWNLFDLLYEFIELNRIPKGPLLLRELAFRVFRPWKMWVVNKNHKIEMLNLLFSMYPDIKFILIGDSGQKDPEVYSSIINQFPDRVLAVYIRDIGVGENLARLQNISETEMLLVKDTEAAAEHAINKGFIKADYLSSIVVEKHKDVQKSQE